MTLFDAGDHFALNFVHKRLLGVAKGFFEGGPLGAARSLISGGGRGGGSQQIRGPFRQTVRRSATARPSAAGAIEQQKGRDAKFAPQNPLGSFPLTSGCIFPARRDPRTGQCKIFLGSQTGRDDRPISTPTRVPITVTGDVGEAVMGRYGAGLVPGSQVIDRATCLRGMQLGNDGLCYNKGQISNKERMWPRGRRPLLSGGEMRAISIASTAARRLTRTAVRLQEIGLIKKPIVRKHPKKKG